MPDYFSPQFQILLNMTMFTIFGSGANAIAVHWVTGCRALMVKLMKSDVSSSSHSASYSQVDASHADGYRHEVNTVPFTVKNLDCIHRENSLQIGL